MDIDITVENPRHACRGVSCLTVDGTVVSGTQVSGTSGQVFKIPLALLHQGAFVRAELG